MNISEEIRKKYYNDPAIWDKNLLDDPADRNRIEELINSIPRGAETILDVGCGNGPLVNLIYKKFKRVVGLDFSQEALKHVKSEKVLADISNIPFENKSFDLVVCSETLEHLAQEDYLKAIEEIKRICKKYIILTVPNDENLKRSSETCPNCKKLVHPSYHFRSFSKKDLGNIFIGFDLIKIKELGDEYPKIPGFLIYPAIKLFRKPGFTRVLGCPFCGYERGYISKKKKQSMSFLSWAEKKAKLIFPKKPYWLLAVYSAKS